LSATETNKFYRDNINAEILFFKIFIGLGQIERKRKSRVSKLSKRFFLNSNSFAENVKVI